MINKEQLISKVVNDLYEGNICNDSSSTLDMLVTLIELLDEESLKKFCEEYSYNNDDSITQRS